jgi:hypothetical protein
MEEDQHGMRNQQSDSVPNQSSDENNSGDNLKEESNSKLQNNDEVDKNAISQRKPQFRFQENYKKRYI